MFKQTFDTSTYKGVVSLNTGLFIGGQFVEPLEGGKIEYVQFPLCSVTDDKLYTA